MIDSKEEAIIKDFMEEFLTKMTMVDFSLKVSAASQENQDAKEEKNDSVEIQIVLPEPQMLIGQNGQTLIELQRLLRLILNKKVKKLFYVNIDINDYKKEKNDYLKKMAEDSANEVALTKTEKILPPMSPSERRIIHMELSKREDIITESQSDGDSRYIVIKARP